MSYHWWLFSIRPILFPTEPDELADRQRFDCSFKCTTVVQYPKNAIIRDSSSADDGQRPNEMNLKKWSYFLLATNLYLQLGRNLKIDSVTILRPRHPERVFTKYYLVHFNLKVWTFLI